MTSRVTAEYPYVFPPVRFFQKALLADHFLLADTFRLPKREKINRYRVLGFVGCVGLVVPLQRGRRGSSISEVEVAAGEDNWRTKHWRSLSNMYSAAPFFEYYADELQELLSWQGRSFLEFAVRTIRWCSEKLSLATDFRLLSELSHELFGDTALLDAAKKLGAETYVMLAEDKDVRNVSRFRTAGVDVKWVSVGPVTYHQLSPVTCPGVSILDLLVNEGPEARQKLLESVEQD